MKKIVYIVIKVISIFILMIISLLTSGFLYYNSTKCISLNSKNSYLFNRGVNFDKIDSNEESESNEEMVVELSGGNVKVINEIEDWRLVLVNSENLLPKTFTVELVKLNGSKEFDARAANELMQMIQAMKSSGVKNIWIQSAYRTPEYQDGLYQNKVKEFIALGKTKEDAEVLASKWVNKSETSEHNLGLAVDFNNVKKDFEKTPEFNWLIKNAENYGFILRYKKEKKNITKVNYEPWHWRYVGVEHAKEMNRLDMCLEEYVEYIKELNKKEYKK